MSRLVSRAESWEKVYVAFANINFSAFDYNIVKQSILDYLKLYFPETFNDFIESSELIAIVESFAYIAEILAYRMDVVAHENFISTAQRRDSILKLAKLVSYKVSRPLPARGLVKITSVSTTETLIDSNGVNLAGRTIRWNDSTNTSWKDQFILVMNRVLSQEFGSVVATDRFQIQDVLFEIYPLQTTQGIMSYSASMYGESVGMELVPVAKSVGDAYTGTVSGISERRPQQNAQFTLLYGSDGLGDGSETTGFFCFTKQGTLQKFTTSFDGITPNQIFEVPLSNVNDTDVWVNAVDPDTGDIVAKETNLPYRRETVEGKYGEWVEVDIAHAQNVIFNTNPKRNKYEVETVGDNRVRILFGDGEFADIPQGTFDIWARTSLNEDIVVPQSSVIDIPISFAYTDIYNQSQTFTFTITLIGSLQNASAAETTEHVRQTAPSVYYTQDRMVNGEDYNVYMRQNPTILKLRAVNRTFAGDSKYITWHDSSNTYENVKMFGDDGILYIQDKDTTQITPSVETNVLISTYIEPLLASTDVFLQLVSAGVSYTEIRRVFTAEEKARITTSLTPPPSLRSADLYFNTFNNEWYAVKTNLVIDQVLNFGGYHIINFNGFASSVDKTIAYHNNGVFTTYGARFTVPSGVSVDVLVTTDTQNTILPQLPQTFGQLLDVINAALVAYNCTAELSNGDIIIRASASIDSAFATTSTIQVVEATGIGDAGLFTSIITNPNTTEWAFFEEPVSGYAYPTNFINYPLIKVRQQTEQDQRYNVTRAARRIVFESNTTSFWNTNNADRVMDYDTLRSSDDTINILQANTNCNRDGILQRNWNYNILGQEIIESGVEAGTDDIHRVSVISIDENQDNIPDYLNVLDADKYMGIADIIVPKLHITIPANTTATEPYEQLVTLPVKYIAGMGDISVIDSDTGVTLYGPTFAVSDGTPTTEFGTQYSAHLTWQPAIQHVNPLTLQPVVENGIVATLPTPGIGGTIGAIGDRYYQTSDSKVYTVATVIADPVNPSQVYIETYDSGVTVTAGINATFGVTGDRCIDTSTGKIHTVISHITVPNPNAQLLQPTVSYITMLDAGVVPEQHWAVYVNDSVNNIHEVWEYRDVGEGSMWTQTTQYLDGVSWYETDVNGTNLKFGQPTATVKLVNLQPNVEYNLTITENEYVYFYRSSISDVWSPVESTIENMLEYVDDYVSYMYEIRKFDDLIDAGEVYLLNNDTQQQYEFRKLWKRHLGRDKLNFSWFHFSPRYQLVDPSPSNIIDIFIITRGYFISYKRWLEDPLALPPDQVTPLMLRNDYGKLLDNKMASDTVVLHPGKIKLIFGDKATPALQARFKVIRSANSTYTDNQIKSAIVATVRNFFDIAAFEFGETFYFTELASAIHMDLPTEISSVVLVPTLQNSQFGDLLQVVAREDEIIYPDIGVEDIDIVAGFTATNLRLNG